MKNRLSFTLLYSALLMCVMSLFQSCAVVGGIFKAGVWVGIIIVVAIIALVIFIISRAAK